jgi:hypothetical protein
MITIFHGDNPTDSRQAFYGFISQFPGSDLLHIDSKSIDLNQINNFLAGGSLFPGTKILAVDNFFSISKPILDKLVKLINPKSVEIIIWQDKILTATQTKIFSQAKLFSFKADNRIFACLNALKPHNLETFNRLYDQIIDNELFDLFLYLLKSQFRRQLQTYSKYDQALVQKIYLQTIELEYQYKSGQLSLPREIALKRVLLPLLR